MPAGFCRYVILVLTARTELEYPYIVYEFVHATTNYLQLERRLAKRNAPGVYPEDEDRFLAEWPRGRDTDCKSITDNIAAERKKRIL
jgi:hypothetical protein